MQVIFYNRDFTATAQPPAKVSVERYSKNMTGGCKDAFLKIENVADKWEMMKLLRAPVEIYGNDGELVWWGFVNRATVPVGESQRLGLGLNELYNYITVTYDEGVTAAGSDAVSIAEYGQKEKSLTDTGLNSTNATAKRDLYLQEHKYASPEIEFSGGSQEISLECYGWNSTFGWKHYASTTTTNTAHETQITSIVTDAGQFFNGCIVTDASGLTSSKYRDGAKTAAAYIDQLLAAGTSNTQPYLSYVDKDRYLHVYERTAQPAQPEYLLREDGKLITRLGKVVPDQECKVAVWVKPKDAPATLEGFSSMYSFFIESAEYNVAQDKTTYRAAGAYEQIRLQKYVESIVTGDGGGNYTSYEPGDIYYVLNPLKAHVTFTRSPSQTLSPAFSTPIDWTSSVNRKGGQNYIIWPYESDDAKIRLLLKGFYTISYQFEVGDVQSDAVGANLQILSITQGGRFPSDATTEIAYIGDSITLYFTGARTIRTYFEGTNDEVDDSITAKGEMQITYWGR